MFELFFANQIKKLDARKLDHETLAIIRIRAVKAVQSGEHPDDVIRLKQCKRSWAICQFLTNERGEVLEIGLGPTPAKILAARDAILEAIVQLRLEELFDRDFEHLKEKGACIVGQYMTRHILLEFGENIVKRKIKDCRRI